MKINIHHKITLFFIFINAVIFLGIFIYLNNNLKSLTYNRIKENLHKQTSLVKSLLDENIIKNTSQKDFDKFADDIGENLKLRVTIIDINGKVLGDSDLSTMEILKVENHLHRPEIEQVMASGTGESTRFSATVNKDMLYIALLSNKNIVVRLSVPLSEIESLSSELKKILVVSFVIAFIFGIFISYMLSNFLIKPIKDVSAVAKLIANGDFSKKILIKTNDEIEELAKAFNYMSEQIKLRIDEAISSTTKLEAVLLSMSEGVMAVDITGKIILINQALKNFLQINEEIKGKRPIEAIRRMEIQNIVDEVLNSSRSIKSQEITIFSPDEKILLLYAAPIIYEKNLNGVVLIFHDITNLRHLENIRKDFAANVSHELRTPITNIKGYSETLLDGALEDKENAKEFLKIIHSNSERLAQLIDDILSLSAIESGKMKINFQSCNIKLIISKAISMMDKNAKEKSIEIKTNIEANVSNILADENLIAQIMINLIDNAIKYNNIGGKITISAYDEDKFVRINVFDTGIGIPDEDIPRIFERFYRVDKARSKESDGTGLGLAIVKHLIILHGGEITVKSIKEEGSTFSFIVLKV